MLKLYDRRFSPEQRDNLKAGPWTSQSEQEYCDFITNGDGRNFIAQLPEHTGIPQDSSDWNTAQKEAFLHDYMQQSYESETEVYRRMKKYQGDLIPHLHAFITIPRHRSSKPSRQLSDYLDCPGILLQYIQGVPLEKIGEQALADNPPLCAPKEEWQRLCDDAMRITRFIGDHHICNLDVKPRNFVVTKSPADGAYKVFMIDFALCLFRDDQNDEEWDRIRIEEDEEGAVGLVMRRILKGAITYERSDWFITLRNRLSNLTCAVRRNF